MIDLNQLERIGDEKRLAELVRQGVLVALLTNRTLAVSPALPKGRRYVLPHVNLFLESLSEDFYEQFGKPLTVDSAVRSVMVQRRLRMFNRNAAPIHGETASSHEAGCTVDLSKRLTKAQLEWLRYKLWYCQAVGWVIVEEERNCIHICVVPKERLLGSKKKE
jgi:hypothetical protein